MLKIMEIHPALNARGEYIVLQNTGLVTLNLRGWAVCTEAYLDLGIRDVGTGMYVFHQDIPIKPYMRVVLFSGCGADEWMPTTDGKQAYCAYWNRAHSVWTQARDAHTLHIAASKRVVPEASPLSAVPAVTYNNSEPQPLGEWQTGYAVVASATTKRLPV